MRAQRARARQARSLGPGVRLGEAAREALRLPRPGSETALPGDEGAARDVQAGRDALWLEDRARDGPGVAPRRALLFDPRPGGQNGRAVLCGPLRAPLEARRRLDGRCDHAAAQKRARAVTGRLSQLQLLRAR